MISSTDREISCRITKTLLLYVREKNKGSLGNLLAGLGLDEKYLLDTDNWVSHDFLLKLYDRMVTILQDENAVYHMALASDRLKTMSRLDRIGRMLGNPRLIYSQSPLYNKFLKLNGEVYIHEIGDSWVVLEDRYHVSELKTRYDCDYTRGILEGIPTIFDLPPARVEEITCQIPAERYGLRTWEDHPRQGAKCCLYRVSWDPQSKPSFWKQLLKYGIFLTAIRDVHEANRKIQEKYNEVRQLASDLQLANQELKSAHKQQELYLQDLKLSEERYRLLAENTSDIIWTMSLDDMRFTYVSPSVEKVMGYGMQESLSLRMEQLLTPRSLQKAMAAIGEELAKETIKGVDPNRSVGLIAEHIYKDGSCGWCEIKGTFLRDVAGRAVGILGMTRNVNERIQAQEKLRESESRLNAIFEYNPTAIVLIEKETRKIININNSARQLIGLPVEDILGMICHNFICPAEFHSCPICDLGQTVNRSERFLLRRDGSKIPVLKTVVVINIDGKEYLLESFINISEQKRADEENRLLQERLQRAEKMEALGTLAGGVAHDLNNVLGVIVGYSELLLGEIDKTSPIRPQVVNIMKGGERAAAIVQDLLTIARRNVSVSKVINLNDIINDYRNAPELEKLLSLHPAVQIETNLEKDLLNILGSPVHLNKTIMNLCLNAAEAMPQGGTVTITTRNQYLDVPVQGYDDVNEGDYVILAVADTGEGIPAADQKRIFEPFYTKKIMGRSGTGLGLAVVWGTVKDHKGYINVHSAERKGTTITLYFPVTRQEISRVQNSLPLSEYMGNGESILVVDDIYEQRDLAVQIMTRLNYKVTAKSSGEEALQYLKTARADLIVLDMIMEPGMDGLDTYNKILEIHPRQKAIIVSGFSDTDRVRQAQLLGAGAYVSKPYVKEKLGLAVRKELDRPMK
jgi:PAS domain S-box-containing protein